MRSHPFFVRLPFAVAAVFVFSCLVLPQTVWAQGGAGIRGGVSASPDQFYFGAHLDTGYVVEHLSFRPNLEVGVGNDLTTIAGNFEFAYWFPIRRHPWSVYAGGGPSLNVYRHDFPGGSTTDTQPGFNLLIGLAHRGGLFTEFKLGFIDSPEVKFGIGYTWR